MALLGERNKIYSNRAAVREQENVERQLESGTKLSQILIMDGRSIILMLTWAKL